MELLDGYGYCAYTLFSRGPVAQLVEQRIENPRVDGSIPSQATTKFLMLFSKGGW